MGYLDTDFRKWSLTQWLTLISLVVFIYFSLFRTYATLPVTEVRVYKYIGWKRITRLILTAYTTYVALIPFGIRIRLREKWYIRSIVFIVIDLILLLVWKRDRDIILSSAIGYYITYILTLVMVIIDTNLYEYSLE